MTGKEIYQLRQHPDAPFIHEDFCYWLHNQIVAAVSAELEALPNGFPATTLQTLTPIKYNPTKC